MGWLNAYAGWPVRNQARLCHRKSMMDTALDRRLRQWPRPRRGLVWTLTAVLLAAAIWTLNDSGQAQATPPLELFLQARDLNDRAASAAMSELAKLWQDSYTPMIIDMARLLRRAPTPANTDTVAIGPDEDPGDSRLGASTPGGFEPAPVVRRESLIRRRLLNFLERQTRQRFGEDLNAWREWMWKLPNTPHPQYAEFKGAVYATIDPRFRQFFPPGVTSRIRLDEIDWGGVAVNGIPPLYSPKVLKADEARYLRDRNIVFGVVVNGEARAYPKRILAWHEMAVDVIGGVPMTIVYCTLCGTVIPYESTVGGEVRRFGTSGLLYRSNKLMFDEGTASLWSTLEGEPVVGRLVGSGLELVSHAAVTTTWGEWRAEHPTTTVLSLDTGHTRDYSEGAAYRDYFSNDDLYFRVAHVDRRLKNKAEVLTLRVDTPDGNAQAVALAAEFLKRNPVYDLTVGERHFVVVTSRQGANRVYRRPDGAGPFQGKTAGASHVVDASGRRWRLTEEALVADDDAAVRLPRVSAQRAFWFGWVAQFPETLLVK